MRWAASGIMGRLMLITNDCLYRTDKSRLVSAAFKHIAYHICCGCLAFCTCNSNCKQLFCRISEPRCRHKRICKTCVVRLNNRNILRYLCIRKMLHIIILTAYYYKSGTLADYIADICMSVAYSTHYTYKCTSGRYLTRIRCKACYVRVTASADNRCIYLFYDI